MTIRLIAVAVGCLALAFGELNFVGRGSNEYQALTGGEGAAYATIRMSVVPRTSGATTVLPAPASVATGAWESDTQLRVLQEQANVTLDGPITVDGTTIAAGTKVNVYDVNADAVGSANVARTYAGTSAFGEPVLAIAVLSADLQATTPLLGHPGTTYATGSDQGAERWAGDVATRMPDGTSVNLSLTTYNTSDAVRIITRAS